MPAYLSREECHTAENGARTPREDSGGASSGAPAKRPALEQAEAPIDFNIENIHMIDLDEIDWCGQMPQTTSGSGKEGSMPLEKGVALTKNQKRNKRAAQNTGGKRVHKAPEGLEARGDRTSDDI